jgi:hypothetical protein
VVTAVELASDGHTSRAVPRRVYTLVYTDNTRTGSPAFSGGGAFRTRRVVGASAQSGVAERGACGCHTHTHHAMARQVSGALNRASNERGNRVDRILG